MRLSCARWLLSLPAALSRLSLGRVLAALVAFAAVGGIGLIPRGGPQHLTETAPLFLVVIAGSVALNNGSKLMCAWAGVIQIVSPGQTTVMIP